jgi:hypothetical protein
MDHLGLRVGAVPAMRHSPFVPGAVRERGLFRRRIAELPRLRRLDVRSNRIARLTDWGVRVSSCETGQSKCLSGCSIPVRVLY